MLLRVIMNNLRDAAGKDNGLGQVAYGYVKANAFVRDVQDPSESSETTCGTVAFHDRFFLLRRRDGPSPLVRETFGKFLVHVRSLVRG
jgi:hypothetical protein